MEVDNPHKWCILFLHMTGGSATATADTLPQVFEKAKAISARHGGSYLLATLPYLIPKVGNNLYDSSVPALTREQWCEEFVKKYSNAD